MPTFIVRRAHEKGLRIVDAKAPLVLEVTRTDITKALQKNAKCCAYARAAKRCDPEVNEAFFFRTTAYLEYGDRMERYRLPPSVQKEIVSFDRAKVMAPGTYQIAAPKKSHSLRETRKRSRRAHSSQKASGYTAPGNTGIKRGVVHRTQLIRTLQDPDTK